MAPIPPTETHYTPLMELQQIQQAQPPPLTKTKEGKHPSTREDGHKSLHKKTLSSISLQSLAGRDTGKPTKPKDKEFKANKQKKTTNLSNFLSRPKSSKSLRKAAAEQEAAQDLRNKENENPNTLSQNDTSSRPPPIYAQFSSAYFANQTSSGNILEDEINLYTPREYSPAKQRDFYDHQGGVPTLDRRDGGLQRPKSTYLPSSFSLQDISRRIGGSSPRHSSELTRKVSGAREASLARKAVPGPTNSTMSSGSRISRVVGAKPRAPETEPLVILDQKDVDREFEAMLDRRNIPEHQREKMRSLTLLMKRDFIRQDCAETAASRRGGHGTNSSHSSGNATVSPLDLPEAKSKRPRSLTFTLSRGTSKDSSSPIKKLKPQATIALHSRTSSSDSLVGGGKSFAASSAAAAQTLTVKAKGQLPDDFVSYLRKVQKPESVEVGRLHKLRILLRNETVSWIEGFIEQGGMEEIVGLLHRTMEVEWRYVKQACLTMALANR
jgi:hypothetical protein